MPYLESFPDKLLFNAGKEPGYEDMYAQAVEAGMSVRMDGVLYYNKGEACAAVYGLRPAVYEFPWDYYTLNKKGCISHEWFTECLNTGKPSYIQMSPEMYNSDHDYYNSVQNLIGYYFRFVGADYSYKANTYSTVNLSLHFRNDGFTPLYEPGVVRLALLDENQEIVQTFDTDINQHTWAPGEDITENVSISMKGVELGTYLLAVGVCADEDEPEPTYLLGSTGRTTDNWYTCGWIEVETLLNPTASLRIRVEDLNYNLLDEAVLTKEQVDVEDEAVFSKEELFEQLKTMYTAGYTYKRNPFDDMTVPFGSDFNYEVTITVPVKAETVNASITIQFTADGESIIGETVLTKSGHNGKDVIFTAGEIRDAATENLPESYTVQDGYEFQDLETTFGSSETLIIPVSKPHFTLPNTGSKRGLLCSILSVSLIILGTILITILRMVIFCKPNKAFKKY